MAAMSLSEHDLAAMRDIVQAATTDDGTLREGMGLPLSVLRALQRLVPCDELCVAGADWKVLGHYLDDSVYGPEDEDIERFTAREPIAYDGAGPEHGFWGTFWVDVCSRPERTGDYASVTRLSDFASERELRSGRGYAENLGPRGFLHETMVVWPDGRGRTLRVLFFRAPGRDFDERDRFVLELLRPHLMAAYTTPEQARDPVAHLTQHQRTILRFVADGYTNAQIGRRLNLAEGTVRTHLSRIYRRLDVTSRTAAAQAYLADEGLRRTV
jgi:DNA-binding CsgD family transcriptional regulator